MQNSSYCSMCKFRSTIRLTNPRYQGTKTKANVNMVSEIGEKRARMLSASSTPLLASNSTFLAIRILIEEKRQFRSLVWWWTKEITHSNRTQNMLPFVGEYHKIVLSRNTVKKYFFNIFYILVYFILLLLFLVIYYINLSSLTFNLKIQ